MKKGSHHSQDAIEKNRLAHINKKISNEPIIKNCIICGIEYKRKTRTEKCWVNSKFCSNKCKYEARIGTHFTEQTRKKQSEARMGKEPWNKGTIGLMPIPWNKGVPATEEQLKCLSQTGNHYPGGENHWNWTGGQKLSDLRHTAKRRKLGNELINEPISDDEVAHHLTKDYVAYVPEYINKSIYHNIHTNQGMDEVNFYTLNYLFLVYNKEE